jgi:hypothetical protein
MLTCHLTQSDYDEYTTEDSFLILLKNFERVEGNPYARPD